MPTNNKLQEPIMALAKAVCDAYGLEMLSFNEMHVELLKNNKHELADFFGGLTSLWVKAEDDRKL